VIEKAITAFVSINNIGCVLYGAQAMLTKWRLLTIIRGGHMTKKFAPVHPGEILLEEFLKPMGISQYRLASDIGVHPRRINEIVHGNRTITADTALRLSRYFGLSERFWLNLQARYDLEVEKDRLEGRLEKEVKVFAGDSALQVHN
jgi:addiction module HigA family antidote